MHKMLCTFSMSENGKCTCEICKLLLECGKGQRKDSMRKEFMQEYNETYEQFVNEVTEAVTRAAGKEYTVIPRRERKNNSVILDGIMLQRGNERVVPNIYLNHYYARYCDGMEAGAIAEQILALCEEKREEIDELAQRLDFSPEYIREHLYYRLIGREQNEALLQEIPHRCYLNLAVVYYWVVYEEEEQLGSIMMTQRQMERLGWTEELLMQTAQENTPRLFPMVTKGMEEIVGELLMQQSEQPILVLSNEKGINGAACLLYPGMLKGVEEKMQGSFYVLPSSIHELIVIPDNGTPAARLCEMVYCINRTQLPWEDVLSDAVYYYSQETKELRVFEREENEEGA